jgi:hypothetical protein
MTRPPLTLALTSVLAAQVEGAGRPALLATLHPEFGRTIAREAATAEPGLATVIPLPRVIPMPRHHQHPAPDPDQDHPDHPGIDPTTAA